MRDIVNLNKEVEKEMGQVEKEISQAEQRIVTDRIVGNIVDLLVDKSWSVIKLTCVRDPILTRGPEESNKNSQSMICRARVRQAELGEAEATFM